MNSLRDIFKLLEHESNSSYAILNRSVADYNVRYKFPVEYDDGQRHIQLWLPSLIILIATIIGYFGNGLIVAASVINPKLQGSCNILLVMTVIADSIHMTSHWYYFYIVTISADNFIPYSECLKFNLIPQFFLISGVVFTLFVGLDRLYAVTFPISYNTTSKAQLLTGCVLVSLICSSYFTAISLNDLRESGGQRRVLCIIIQSLGGRAYTDFFHFSFALTVADLIIYSGVWLRLRKSSLSISTSNADFKVFKSLFVIILLVAVGWFVNASMMSLVVPHLVDDDYNCIVSAYFGVLVNVAASLSVLPLYLYSHEYRKTIDKIVRRSAVSKYQISPLSGSSSDDVNN
ncbi:unnamed protein product [Bursaphelenchus xylophilus]|uniref:(pine wood nematode) hypothetical protein n=1 Tax=Bursaphelenchus xylophilus TaxID=6326 RepID=A0A7I8X291_BURXY|nr:unnamed protein product [Bursaphelenchus xylophilus]CAG9130996.1 unnamed protein product [Bursaphelenchus xylophilus]